MTQRVRAELPMDAWKQAACIVALRCPWPGQRRVLASEYERSLRTCTHHLRRQSARVRSEHFVLNFGLSRPRRPCLGLRIGLRRWRTKRYEFVRISAPDHLALMFLCMWQ